MASLAENKECVNISPPLISSILVRSLVASRGLTDAGSIVQTGTFGKDVESSQRSLLGAQAWKRESTKAPRWLRDSWARGVPGRLGCESRLPVRHLGCEGPGGAQPLGLDVHGEGSWEYGPSFCSEATGEDATLG